MLHQLLVTATDLDRWADLLEGKATFPELLRRLIINTSPSLTSISFESAEGIQLGGWDGLTNANQHTAFVPAGPAGWELGTNQDRKGKADDDYTKRTSNPLGLTPASSTFIFCTPRRWGNKDVWENSRNAEGNWLKVKVYDANDLITWLIKAPAVHLWLSTLLHKRPAGVTDLETYSATLHRVMHEDAALRFTGLTPGPTFAAQLAARTVHFINDVATARYVQRF